MRVLVTGANGFIGSHLQPELLARGVTVISAVRHFIGKPDEVVVGELGPLTDWSKALDGIDAVVHLAGRAHVLERVDAGAERARLWAVNVEGVQQLANACRKARVQQVVFLSSLHAVATASEVAIDEATEPEPSSLYGQSKLEAEKVLQSSLSQSGVAWTILRPPLIYGAGQKANMDRLVRLVQSGCPLPLASVTNRRSLMSVDNLCSLIYACLNSAQAHGRIFGCRDGEDVSTPELLRRMGNALGVKTRLFPLSPSLLRWMGSFPVLGGLAKLCDSLFINDSAVRDALGWRPPLTLDQGLARMRV